MFEPPRWFAHRGGGALAPENTLAGIRLAARLGFRAVEFDVALSGDGTPVLIHDATLARTTDGDGEVAETPDRVLFSLDAGNGEHVPRLAEAAALCRQYGLLANVEIKPARGDDERCARAVVDQCAALWRGAEQQLLLSSFSPAALLIARDLAPQLRRGLLYDRVPPDWAAELRRLAGASLHCNGDYPLAGVFDEARALAVPVLCYTINSAERASALFEAGAGALFTDRLDLFAAETTAYRCLHSDG